MIRIKEEIITIELTNLLARVRVIWFALTSKNIKVLSDNITINPRICKKIIQAYKEFKKND